MRGRSEIVTICGSTKFKNEYLGHMRELEEKGYIVLSVGSFMHADGIPYTKDHKEHFDKLHKEKIKMSDWILVLNVGGYIGESTAGEIEYAKNHGVRVEFLEPIDTEPRYPIRPEVLRFASIMERKLRRNDHKRQWSSYGIDKIQWFLDCLIGEVKELEDALRNGSVNDIEEEAADVGNFAMMIADINRKGDSENV